MVSSKKKKGLHFDFISDLPIFLPKSRCSLKKKRSSLPFALSFSYFSPKIRVFSKKKKKKSLSLRIVLYTLNKHLQRIKTVCVIFEGDLKKRGAEATASFASPNIHHWHHLSSSKWSPCSLRCRQGPCDLADRNMDGNLVDLAAAFYLPQTKKQADNKFNSKLRIIDQ